MAQDDAFRIGLAIAHGMDFLVTWNCTHIANAAKRNLITSVASHAGYLYPRGTVGRRIFGLIRLSKNYTFVVGNMPLASTSTCTGFFWN